MTWPAPSPHVTPLAAPASLPPMTQERWDDQLAAYEDEQRDLARMGRGFGRQDSRTVNRGVGFLLFVAVVMVFVLLVSACGGPDPDTEPQDTAPLVTLVATAPPTLATTTSAPTTVSNTPVPFPTSSSSLPLNTLPIQPRETFPFGSPDYGTMVPGMTSSLIQPIMEVLTDLGYEIDQAEKDAAYYGPSTFEAVIDFQVSRGLVPDGWVGTKTRLALGLGSLDPADNVVPEFPPADDEAQPCWADPVNTVPCDF